MVRRGVLYTSGREANLSSKEASCTIRRTSSSWNTEWACSLDLRSSPVPFFFSLPRPACQIFAMLAFRGNYWAGRG
jgi:hypothetical protein